MLIRPQFKPHYHLEWVDGEGAFVLSESGPRLLRGRLYEQVGALIDGRRSVTDVIDQLRDQFSAAEVYYAVQQLERKGYLAEGDDRLPAGEAALWAIHGIDPRQAAGRLAETRVTVTALGGVEAEPLRALLLQMNVRLGEPGDLGVVLTDDYLRPSLQAYNRQALAAGRPWLLVKPVGALIWVGPVFRPGKTGCWECLAHRLGLNRETEAYLQAKKGSAEPLPVARAVTPATLQLAWNLAATETARWIVKDGASDLEGKILTLDVQDWQTRSHVLVRRPQCPACGRPDDYRDRAVQPLVLQSRPKIFTEDGGHRGSRPEETLARYEHHVSPISGAVAVLGKHGPSSDGVFHVYLAGANPAAGPRTMQGMRRGFRSSSSGKGTSDLQAKASGLGEALERFSGIFQGDEPRRRARLRELDGAAIHPNTCMLYSERQFLERETWNARKSRFNHVPVPFDVEAEIDWTPVWSLTRREVRYLPTAYCYFGYPDSPEADSCDACSNGNAAGNTLEEAILQGFLELVERDSVALWWYNRVRRPSVCLDSFDDPYLERIDAFLRDRRRNLWVLDLTSDLQIPTFVALSRRIDQPAENLVFGFGAHLDPRIALLRAVTELNQMLAMVLGDGGEKPIDAIQDPETVHWLQTATLANQPHLVPDAHLSHQAADFPRRWTGDLKEDVLICQALVEGLGMEMLVLDQTRPDIGMPVAKVFVPGLRHFWARFAPGRLYDVPVRLGWLPQSLTEEQLNPVPMFL
jgi:ribosomal protein S12 methylthiotransferase accessory factor